MRSAFISLEFDLVKMSALLVTSFVVIVAISVNLLHGKCTFQLSGAKHGGHLTDVVSDGVVRHSLLIEQGLVLVGQSFDLALKASNLLLCLVASPGSSLGSGAARLRVSLLVPLLSLLLLLAELL